MSADALPFPSRTVTNRRYGPGLEGTRIETFSRSALTMAPGASGGAASLSPPTFRSELSSRTTHSKESGSPSGASVVSFAVRICPPLTSASARKGGGVQTLGAQRCGDLLLPEWPGAGGAEEIKGSTRGQQVPRQEPRRASSRLISALEERRQGLVFCGGSGTSGAAAGICASTAGAGSAGRMLLGFLHRLYLVLKTEHSGKTE